MAPLITTDRLRAIRANRNNGDAQPDQLRQAVHVAPGGSGEIRRLARSLEIDASPARERLVNRPTAFEQEGIAGYGEVCPLGPFYLPAYGVAAAIGALNGDWHNNFMEAGPMSNPPRPWP